MIEVRTLLAVLAAASPLVPAACSPAAHDRRPAELTLERGQRIEVRSDVLGAGWHRARLGRISLPVTGEECSRIAVPDGTKGMLLFEAAGLDSVRARTGDEGWTTVAGERVRMPEPRC